ncbi:hypothetical protein D3C72_1329930 [compost metagenome]
MGNIVNVNTTGSYISCNDCLQHFTFEAIHYFGTHFLIHITVQRTYMISFTHQFFRNILSILFGAGKDNTVNIRCEIQ